MSKDQEIYDVVIIGGGPAGTSAAIYAARAELKTLVIDKAPLSGALAVTPKIANYPGVPEELRGADLLARMRQQAISFGAEYVQEPVVAVDLKSDPKTVFTNTAYQARAIIIATGANERGNRVPGEAELVGRGVSYCATCDGAFFKGQEVAVVGASDEAVEEAEFLTRYASRVHLVLPRSSFQAPSEMVERLLAHSSVTLHENRRLKAVDGDEEVRTIRLVNRVSQDELDLPVSGVFIYLQGGRPGTSFLNDELERGEGGCILIDRTTMETTIPGVYAVGDVTCSRLKQAVISAAEGAIAAISADKFINRSEKTSPGRYW
jgi:thioredoxin reductase (NADPH)